MNKKPIDIKKYTDPELKKRKKSKKKELDWERTLYKKIPEHYKYIKPS